MKNLRKFRILVILLLIPVSVLSQDCELYFSLDEGTVQKIAHYNNKDKLTGTTEILIAEKREIAGGMEVKLEQTYVDEKDNSFEANMMIECVNGVLYFDMNDFLDPNTMMAYEGMEIEVSADKLPFPSDAKPGDQLENGVITATIRQSGVKIMTIVVEVFDRMVEAEETIETPAGSFECLKIKYNVSSQFGFVKMNMSNIEWFNWKVGTVRAENYNKKGKLTDYTVLQEIN